MSDIYEQERPRKCFVCGKPRLEPEQRQTCTPCLGRTRRDLIEIEQLYALLPSAVGGATAGSIVAMSSHSAESPVPGGDALVMLAPGSDGKAAALASLYGLDDSHAGDDYPSDPPAVLAELGSWEDDWFEVRREAGIAETAPAQPATLMATVTWMTQRLTWAAQQHDAFDQFATDVRRVLGRLRSVTRTGDPNDRAAIECPDCEGDLRREYRKADPCPGEWLPPRPALGYDVALNYHPMLAMRGYWKPCDHAGLGHDQGGMRDVWVCRDRRCARIVEPSEYWLLARDKQERKKREREGADADSR